MSTILIYPPSVEPVTLAEAKHDCRVTTSDDDAKIGRLITAVRESIEHDIGVSLAPQTWELRLDAFPAGEIKLLNGPVTAIVSIKYTDPSGAEQTVSPTDYTVVSDSQVDWAAPAYGLSWPDTLDSANAVRVRYTAGYADGECPDAIRQRILTLVVDYYDNPGGLSPKSAQAAQFNDRLLDRYRVY